LSQDRAERLHRRITGALLLIMAVGFAYALFRREWLNALLLVAIGFITMLPILLGRRFRVFIPPEMELLAIIFIFAALFLGEFRGYYVRFWWWDALLHTASGFLLGLLGFLL